MSTTTFDKFGTPANRPPTWGGRSRTNTPKSLSNRMDNSTGITTVSEEKRRLIQEALRNRTSGKNEKAQRRADQAKRVRRSILAIFLSLFLIGGYGGYQVLFGSLDMNWGSESNGSKEPEIKRDFGIAGVHLGMTYERVKAIHPDLKIEILDTDKMIASFQADSVKYTAWFRPVGDLDVLWKIRFSRFFENILPDQVLNGLADTFGLSYSSACQRSAFRSVPDCQYSWLGADGVNIKAEIYKVQAEPVAGAKTLGTSLTVTALDPTAQDWSLRTDRKKRDRALRKSIASNWKENETWLQAEANKVTREAGFGTPSLPINAD